MSDPREKECEDIRHAYEIARKVLARAGFLLRKTEAGQYLWSARHKTAVSGIRAILEVLGDDVPRKEAGGE